MKGHVDATCQANRYAYSKCAFSSGLGMSVRRREVSTAARHNQGQRKAHMSGTKPRLRLLSFNIQVAMETERLRHYITRSWRHVLPHPDAKDSLDRIARLVRDYDIVALQEADAGSLRTRNVNQIRYLAECAGFPHWDAQINRDFGKIAQHSLGVLCRPRPVHITEHRLPGLIPGRGVLVVRFGSADNPLLLVVTHLALGPRTRRQQLGYISRLIRDYEHVILMGDTNCGIDELMAADALGDTRLRAPALTLNTYPSWQPRRDLDHILVTPSLTMEHAAVIDQPLSDHLPVALEVTLPPGLDLNPDLEG